VLASLRFSGVAHAAATSPAVTPVPGTAVIAGHTEFDLASVGYEQSEYFLQGTATAYSSSAALTPDGKWTVTPSSQAPYVTRIVVNRPIKPSDFNGTVVLEWLNVSGGVDASPEWMQSHVEMIRRGIVWIGVTAQAVGVNSLKAPPAQQTVNDPARYTTLSHPGDSYSYDIFSQAGQAVRDNPKVVLGGLKPKHVLATGESQSAGRLVTYIDAVHPVAQVYDGFLLHSHGAAGSPLTQDPLPAVPTPSPTLIRDDLKVPVLVVNTETDSGALLARRDDTARYRLWEVAGSSHYDQYGLALGATDTGKRQDYVKWFETMRAPTNQPNPLFSCNLPINVGPTTYVLRAGFAALDDWVANGTPPPKAPRLETVSVSPVQYVTDANGNAQGGIRTPAVDAPVAVLGGVGNRGAGPIGQFCRLFGNTVPLTTEQLTARYKTQRNFESQWKKATQAAVKAGFVLPSDGKQLAAVPGETNLMP